MSKREWKPGDVAIRTYLSSAPMASIVVTGEACPAMQADTHPSIPHWHHVDGGWDRLDGRSTYRPLVVIDAEDREQVERLRDLFDVKVIQQNGDPDPRDVTPGARGNALQAALREFANPKPEVFRHYVGSSDGGLKTALCGKVWRLNAEANVTVKGDCPTCSDLVKSGWSA